MFATIKSLIPEPRQADQPRHYVGRHRQPETVAARAAVPVIPAPSAPVDGDSPATASEKPAKPVEAAAAAPEPDEAPDGHAPKA